MSSISENRSFTKLKGRENYDTWKISAKSFLVIKGLWSWTEKEPDASNNTEIENDLKAWSELSLLLDESIYSYIASSTTTKSAWKALEKAFEDSGLSRKVELLKQLVQLKVSDCISIEEYVNRMTTTSLKVKKTGLNIDDEVVAALMLAGLPDEFKPFVMAIENSSTTTKLSSDAVKALLLQDSRLNSKDDDGTGAAFFVKSKTVKTFKYRCHNCGEVGHMAKECSVKFKKHDGSRKYEFESDEAL